MVSSMKFRGISLLFLAFLVSQPIWGEDVEEFLGKSISDEHFFPVIGQNIMDFLYRIEATEDGLLRLKVNYDVDQRGVAFCFCFLVKIPDSRHDGNLPDVLESQKDTSRISECPWPTTSRLCYHKDKMKWYTYTPRGHNHISELNNWTIKGNGTKVTLDIVFDYRSNKVKIANPDLPNGFSELDYNPFQLDPLLAYQNKFIRIAPFVPALYQDRIEFLVVKDSKTHVFNGSIDGENEAWDGHEELVNVIGKNSTNTTEGAASASSLISLIAIFAIAPYVILILAVIIVVLRVRQGVWCCGMCCNRESQPVDDPEQGFPNSSALSHPTQQKTKSKSDEPPKARPSSIAAPPDPNIALAVAEKKEASDEPPAPADAAEVPPPPPPPPPPPAEKKGKGLVTKDTTTGKTTKDKDDSDDEEDGTSSTVPPTAAGATTPPPPPPGGKEKEQAPNLLLFNTKEDRTQSESKAGGRRKNLIDKKNKEPPVTKAATINGEEVQTGMGKATTRKGEMVKDAEGNYKTGIPRSETDLADPLTKTKPGTKGVSATQGDKYTEYGTQPTQGGTTLATGKTRLKTGTTQGQTLAGTQATQGGTTAYGTKATQDGGGTMVTGYAKTSRDGATGQTQVPTAGETGETQIPTGGGRTEARLATTQAGTKTTQQYGTGTTQMASTRTTQAGTRGTTAATQGGTRTTQARTLGTTVAATQQGTRTTQGATGTTQGATRYTGETQLPSGNDEHDVEPTQLQPGKTRTGTTQKTTLMATGVTRGPSGTQLPSDDDEADPTQNPTAFTGRTSRTQVGTTAAATTQMGTSKTRTRDTQKATTKRTDA